MSAPFRVLQVIPTLDTGGAERTTIEIAEALSASGGVALVASRGGRLEGELAKVGGELIRMDMAAKNPITLLANAERLAHLVSSREVGLIHARSRAPAWSALWAARKTGRPFVTTYHGIYNAGGPAKRLYNSVMARGDIVIANSDFTRAHVLSQYGRLAPGRVVAIPRAVDLERFDSCAVAPDRVDKLRAEWGMPKGRLLVLALARLSRWKGQDLLIEAAAKVEAQAPGTVCYVLAGDAQGRDDYVAMLDAMIGRAGLTGIVKRVGHVSDVPAALLASDIAVFPPTSLEAFGRGAVEAQAMGAPVIAADQGGFSETVVGGETGLLFPIGEAAALADAILRMASMSPAQRRAIGAAGAARARALYSKQSLQRSTLEVYRALLQDKPS